MEACHGPGGVLSDALSKRAGAPSVRELKHPDIECGVTHPDQLSPWYIPLVMVIWALGGAALWLICLLWDLTIPSQT